MQVRHTFGLDYLIESKLFFLNSSGVHKNVKKLLFIMLLFCVNNSVFANKVVVIKDTNDKLVLRVTTAYVLGDGDTRVDAKNIALQQAKKLSAEKSGSYIQAEKVIEDDAIKKDSITMISTALMQLDIEKENLSITSEQRTKLELIVTTTLDKASTMAKLGVLKSSKDKKEQITDLQKKNANLSIELAKLNKKLKTLKTTLAKNKAQPKRTDLIERRDAVLEKLVRNESSVRKIFKKGTLFSMAQKSSADYDAGLRDIEYGIWAYLVANTKITLGDPEFQDNKNRTYDIRVPVTWEVDPKPIQDVINKYFRSYKGKMIKRSKRDSLIEISQAYNSKDAQHLAFTHKLYKHLLKKQVIIQISAGKYKSQITMATSRECFVSCKGEGDDKYQIQLNNKSDAQDLFFYKEENPVLIKNVPVSVLESLTDIKATIILR